MCDVSKTEIGIREYKFRFPLVHGRLFAVLLVVICRIEIELDDSKSWYSLRTALVFVKTRFVPNALTSVTLNIHRAARLKSLLFSTAIVAVC